MKTFLITAPEQNNYTNPAVEPNEKKLRAWLDNLPILNLARSVPALVDAIYALNEEPIAPAQRFKLLELYYEPFTSIFYSFDDARLQQMPISKEKKAQIRSDVGKLCQDLANGYKILVKDAFTAQKKSLKKNKVGVSACFRAIEFLSLGLIHAYRTYSASPPFTLLELHQIYKFTEYNQLTEHLFSTRSRDKKISIDELYIRTLLLAISDPFRLPAGGLIALNDRLYQYVSCCEITPFYGKKHDGLFIIDPESDAVPFPSTQLTDDLQAFTDSKPEDLRVLNTEQLIKEILKCEETQSDQYDCHQILNILSPSMSAARKRRRKHQRVEVNKQAYTATGIQAVRFFLSGQAEKKHVLENIDNNYGIQLDDNEQAFSLKKWQVKNEALRGYLLYCHELCDALGAGQLLGVAQNIENPKSIPFTLSIIRWLKAGEDSSIEMGVETIPGIPHLIMTHSATITDPIECLHLPGIPALKTEPLLFMEKGHVEVGDALQIERQQQKVDIEITQILEESTYFDAYHYQEVTSQE